MRVRRPQTQERTRRRTEARRLARKQMADEWRAADRVLLAEVCAKYRIGMKDMLAKQRISAYHTVARREAIVRLRDEFRRSYPYIGRLFNRDHTSMIHSYQMYLEGNPPPKQAVIITRKQLEEVHARYQKVGMSAAGEFGFNREVLIELKGYGSWIYAKLIAEGEDIFALMREFHWSEPPHLPSKKRYYTPWQVSPPKPSLS